MVSMPSFYSRLASAGLTLLSDATGELSERAAMVLGISQPD